MKLPKKVFLCVIALLLVGGFVSCSKMMDMRLTELEKSIEKLEQNYKEWSPEKVQKQIESCEKQLDELSQNEGKLTESQRQRMANLKGQYHRLLLEIKIFTLKHDITEEGTQALEYIKGLLGGE